MDSLLGTVRHNEEAVIREFQEAVADGNMRLAERIAAANPDLFPADHRDVPGLIPRCVMCNAELGPIVPYWRWQTPKGHACSQACAAASI